MEPIEPPWHAIKEWIPDEEPALDWFNRPRNPSDPDPDWFDQTPAWKAPEIQLDDGRILVLESTVTLAERNRKKPWQSSVKTNLATVDVPSKISQFHQIRPLG